MRQLLAIFVMLAALAVAASACVPVGNPGIQPADSGGTGGGGGGGGGY